MISGRFAPLSLMFNISVVVNSKIVSYTLLKTYLRMLFVYTGYIIVTKVCDLLRGRETENSFFDKHFLN